MTSIGFIGLGAMSASLAMNLFRNGYDLTLFDPASDLSEVARRGDIPVAESAAHLASQVETLIMMIPDPLQLQSLILDEEGVLDGAHENLEIITTSAVSPDVIRSISESCENSGVDVLEAILCGTDEDISRGTLNILTGGKREIFENQKEILQSIGKSVVLCGGIGAGFTMKKVAEIIEGQSCASISETFTEAMNEGLDLSLVCRAFADGLVVGQDI